MKLTKTEKRMLLLAAVFLAALMLYGLLSARPGRVTTQLHPQRESLLAAVDWDEADEELLPGQTIDLNSAGYDEVLRLPGIGEVLAARIIQKRQELGGFESKEQLLLVKGIGKATLETIEQFVTIGGSA